MSEPTETDMYVSIGQAVSLCQMFEFLFVFCVKRVFKEPSPTSVQDIAPLDHNSFRPAVTSLLRELKGQIHVDPAFEARIIEFSERRHTLIHRWFVQKGWPSAASDRAALTTLARSVAQDAMDLTPVLAKYVLKWMKNVPELAALAERQEPEWNRMFESAQRVLQILSGRGDR